MTDSKLSHGQAVALMVLVTFLWGTAGLVARHLQQAQSFEVTFWRSGFAFLSMTVILPLWQGRGVWRRIREEGWPLWASGACWSVMFTAFMVALTLTSVANALVMAAAGPLLTALVSRLFLGHRLPARTWAAIVVAALGIGWAFGRQVADGAWLGSVVAMLVPVAGSMNWTLVQRSQAKGLGVDLAPAVMIGGLLSALAMLPLAWPIQTSAHDLILLAGLGLGQLAIPCVLLVVSARVLSAPEVALLALLELLFGVGMAWLGAGEVPALHVMQGGMLVLCALVVNEVLGWRERRASASASTRGQTA
jgi:drug/metabolite transporter (DMT)-like permease